jgi:hypothetical protein
MFNYSHRATLIGLLTSTVASVAFAQGEQVPTDSSAADIDALKARIEALEQNQAQAANSYTGPSLKEEAVSFNGFYSAGISKINRDVTYADGRTNDWDIKPTTLVGLQLNADLYKGGEFVTQVVALGNSTGGETFNPEVDWLYFKHNFGAGFSAQIGRLRSPLLRETNNYYVGYSYPWVQPPEDVYGTLLLTNVDGVSVGYALPFGDWLWDTQLVWGDSELEVGDGGTSLNDSYTLATVLSSDNMSFRLSYLQAEQVVETSVPAGPAEVNLDYAEDIEYLTASFKYDDGMLYASLEGVTTSSEKDVAVESEAWDATVGWYFGSVLAYAGVSEQKAKNADEFGVALNEYYDNNGIDAGAPGSGSTVFGPLTVGDIASAVLVKEQTTYTVGARWDFSAKTALKVQAQYVNGMDGTIGNFSHGSAQDVLPASLGGNGGLPFKNAVVYDIAIQGVF